MRKVIYIYKKKKEIVVQKMDAGWKKLSHVNLLKELVAKDLRKDEACFTEL